MKSIPGLPFIYVFSALVLIVSGFTAPKTKNTDQHDPSAAWTDRSENEATETLDTIALIDTLAAPEKEAPELVPVPVVEEMNKPPVTEQTVIEEVDGVVEEVKPVNNWIVPEGYRNKINPIESSTISLKAGRSLYRMHCASCHGREGLGDGMKANNLDTPAGDFSLPSFQDQTDGELFYKTWIGRDEMPKYNTKLPDQENIWDIINYVRTFSE